jgi:hypothetical protein
VNELDLQGADKAAMENKISGLLHQLMDDYEASYKKEKSRSLTGLLQGAVAGLADVFGQIRREIPNFTKRIMEYIEHPENRENIRVFILEKIDDYTNETFNPIDYTAFKDILSRYDGETKDEAILLIHDALEKNQNRQKPLQLILLIIVGCLLMTLVMMKRIEPFIILLVTLICVCLLVMGISLPMIDIDARIAEMKFTLLGENIQFQDQVLFYKSKSIIEVTRLMLEQGKWDVFLVGVLIFIFSVLFPVSKLIAGTIYTFINRLRKQEFLNFLVFKTGKWSMADVMVVAIFMSFIGFSGIISEQLRQLEGMSDHMEILTTNASQLQIGFFLFTAFVIVSLMLSHRLQYQFK